MTAAISAPVARAGTRPPPRAVRLLMVRTRLRTEAARGGGPASVGAPGNPARSSTRLPAAGDRLRGGRRR